MIACPLSSGNIPPALQDEFRAYVFGHYRPFLLAINFIALGAYDLYVLADILLIPDMAIYSAILRGAMTVIAVTNIFLVFRYTRNLLLMDLLMPGHDLIAAIVWFELLKHSSAPDVPVFLYASVVFIVLGNLGVRYSFRGILLCSVLISGVILYNVSQIHPDNPKALMIFALVYLPVLLFSLFISWTNIRGVQKAFLASREQSRQQAELAILNQRLQTLAHTDGLTGIGNRRAFDLKLEEYWQQTTDSGRHFALLMADIDYFKPYNDNYGHQAGDQCIRQVASQMATGLEHREAEIFRYGGEEFVVLVQDQDISRLYLLAEGLLQQIARLEIEHYYRPDGLRHITISLGAALSSDVAPQQIPDLIHCCDQRLYQAKESGRNCACLPGHQPIPGTVKQYAGQCSPAASSQTAR